MEVDYIIIGQGLCGTWLSYYLERAGRSFILIDDDNPFAASRVASGVINPVTGRRIVKTWMIDELLPFALTAYRNLGDVLSASYMAEKEIIDFFPTAQMRLAFTQRYELDQQYLSLPAEENNWQSFFRYDFGYGIIHPCFLVDLQALLTRYREHLSLNGYLRAEQFHQEGLTIKESGVEYNGTQATKIIFCEGTAGFNNPYFQNLPYGLNKGEVLLVEIPELAGKHIFKKGFSLVPWKGQVYWLGSSYLWEYEHAFPTKGFYQFAENWLHQTLRIPYKIVHHLAAIRPATLERRPFVGLHPQINTIGILNGMGTKGCSLAPYFANQLVNHLLNGSPILPEADTQRFKKILSR